MADDEERRSVGVDPEELAAKLMVLKALEEPSENEELEKDEEEGKEEEIVEGERVEHSKMVRGEIQEKEEVVREMEHEKGGEEDGEVEEKEQEVTKIDVELFSMDEDSEDEDWREAGLMEKPVLYGNVKMFLRDHKVLAGRRESARRADPVERLFLRELLEAEESSEGWHLELERWRESVGCGRCLSDPRCSCYMQLKDILANLTHYFQLVLIVDLTCTSCLQILEIVRKRNIVFCQIDLDDIGEAKIPEVREYLERAEPGSGLVHHWSHPSGRPVDLAGDRVSLPPSDYFDILVIGAGTAALGILLEASRCNQSVCLVDVTPEGSSSLWGFETDYGFFVETIKLIFSKVVDVQQAIEQGRFNGIVSTQQESGNNLPATLDLEVFRTLGRKLVESLAWQCRAGYDSTSALYLTGRPHLVSPNTVLVELRNGGPLEIHCKNIILSFDRKMEYEHFPGLHRYCQKLDKVLELEKLGCSRTLICGGNTSILEFGDIFHSLGMEITLMLDKSFPARYDADVLNLIMNYMEANGMTLIQNQKVYSVSLVPRGANGMPVFPKVTERLMVVSKCLETGRLIRHYFDKVIVLPEDTPFCPVTGLAELGVAFSKFDPKLVEVDQNLRTSVKNIYALGGMVQGMQDDTKVFYSIGSQLVQFLSGKSKTVPRGDLKLGRLLTRPEYAWYGLSETLARQAYPPEEVRVYHSGLRVDPGGYVKLVCRARTNSKGNTREDVVGLHVLGKQCACDIVRGFAPALSEGMTKEQLDGLIGVQFTVAQEVIGLTMLKEGPLTAEMSCCGAGDDSKSVSRQSEDASKCSVEGAPVDSESGTLRDPGGAAGGSDGAPEEAAGGPGVS